jgi:serine protease
LNPSQWYLREGPGANFVGAWAKEGFNTAETTAVPVAVIDTGLVSIADNATDEARTRMEEERDSLEGVWDLVNDVPGAAIEDPVPDFSGATPWDPAKANRIRHGLRTAALIGATTDNDEFIASAGWGNQVDFYRTADDDGVISSAAVTAAIRMVINNPLGRETSAKVINLSLGTSSGAMPADWKTVIDEATAAGITVVAAAGNSGDSGNAAYYPAAYGPVLSVAAVMRDCLRWPDSTYNDAVDLAAPGDHVTTLMPADGLEMNLSGTTYAAALVSAAAALLIRYDSTLTSLQVEQLLRWTAQPRPQGGTAAEYGAGLLDAAAALEYLQAPDCDTINGTYLCPKYTQVTLSPDWSTDGRGEVLALRRDGALLRFNSTSANAALATPVTLKTGLAGQTIYAPGDWDEDGKKDILVRGADGKLYLYKGTASGGLSSPLQCGNGWTNYQIAPAGDLNADGHLDLLAANLTSGALYLYRGNGLGGFLAAPYPQVGQGWNGWQLFGAGDGDGDGKADIYGINSTGQLYFYRGKGTGQFYAGVQAGQGWNGMMLGSGADLSGDAKADIVGVNLITRNLYFYKATGSGGFAASRVIGTAW